MKALLLATMLPLMAPAQDSDKRTIGNVTVDLAPIHKWKESPIGERPLKHWKDVEIILLKKAGSPDDLYLVQIDKHGQDEIYIRNVPEKVIALAAQLTDQTNAIAKLQEQINKDERANLAKLNSGNDANWREESAAYNRSKETLKRMQYDFDAALHSGNGARF